MGLDYLFWIVIKTVSWDSLCPNNSKFSHYFWKERNGAIIEHNFCKRYATNLARTVFLIKGNGERNTCDWYGTVKFISWCESLRQFSSFAFVLSTGIGILKDLSSLTSFTSSTQVWLYTMQSSYSSIIAYLRYIQVKALLSEKAVKEITETWGGRRAFIIWRTWKICPRKLWRYMDQVWTKA